MALVTRTIFTALNDTVRVTLEYDDTTMLVMAIIGENTSNETVIFEVEDRAANHARSSLVQLPVGIRRLALPPGKRFPFDDAPDIGLSLVAF